MTRLLPAIAFALLACLPLPALAGDEPDSIAEARDTIEEGRDFRRVLPAQPTAVQPGQVEVLEFFWYGCPHCFRAEEHIAEWLETKPENVVFRRIPATLNRGWVLMARAYYAAEQLGVLDTMHEALFDAFHGDRQMLGSEERLATFFNEKAGVGEAEFLEAFGSATVSSKVQRADMLARRYRIGGVPAMTVNGRFMTDPEQAGGYDAMLRTIDVLSRWELQEQGD